MGRGFLSGTFWGGLLGAVFLLISSQVLDRQGLSLPKPQASAVEVPAGSEFDQAKPEEDTVIPQSETRPVAEVTTGVPVPQDTQDTPPAMDTGTLEVPTPEVSTPEPMETVATDDDAVPAPPPGDRDTEVDSVEVNLNEPEAPASVPERETDTPAIVFIEPADETPEDVAEDTAPEVDTDVANLVTPSDDGATVEASNDSVPVVTSETSAPTAPSAPSVDNETAMPRAVETDVTDAPVEPQTPAQPSQDVAALEPQPEPTPEPEPEPAPSVLQPVDELKTTPDVETDRLPRIAEETSDEGAQEIQDDVAALPTVRRIGETDEPSNQVESDVDAGEGETGEDAATLENLPALQRFATSFENPEGAPVLSIVLVQNGPLLNEAQLSNLPANLSFAVDAGAPAATITAEHYRSLGREVVMIPSLPKLATPQDVEQALQVNFQSVPEAVAVMDVSGSSFQADRAAVQQVVNVVSSSGHGLITYPRGLNTAHQSAQRVGVETGLIFRQIDANGENLQQISRTLDRAAFRARQEEAVILVGTTEASTLIALLEWGQGNRAASVALAPVSAALSLK